MPPKQNAAGIAANKRIVNGTEKAEVPGINIAVTIAIMQIVPPEITDEIKLREAMDEISPARIDVIYKTDIETGRIMDEGSEENMIKAEAINMTARDESRQLHTPINDPTNIL